MLVVTGDTFKHKDAIKAAGGQWDGTQWTVPEGAELPAGLATRSASEKSPAHAAVSAVLDQFNDPRLDDAKTLVSGSVPARLWKELPADPKTAAKMLAQKVPQVKAAIAAGNIKGASMTDTLIMHALVLGDRPFESIPMTQALVAAKTKGGA